MAKITKTNVARLLDRARIPYELIPYPVDEEHLDANHVADALGEDINRVFKTLVLRGEPASVGYFVCVIPGNCEVDLKKAAKAMGAKKAEMIHVRELQPLTGYIRGGCSPIGMRKPFPTIFHPTATDFDSIYVSAGQRGLQLRINPRSLIEYVGAEVYDIVKEGVEL